MRLATRVTVALTAVTGVALASFLAAVSLLVRRDETRDLDRALLAQAQASSERVLSSGARELKLSEGSARVPEHLGSVPSYVVIYDRQRRVVDASSGFRGAPPSWSTLGVPEPVPERGTGVDLSSADAHGLRGVVIPMDEQGHILLFAAARETIDEDVRFLFRAGSIIFLFSMALTVVFARWLSGRLSRDVENIAAVARSVTEGDLDARVGSRALGSTETRMLAADMDRMIHQLSQLLHSQRTFISHAAHELRSPLTTIRGELQLALRRERDPEGYRAAIQGTLEDVDALATLAEDLLALARIQSVETVTAAAPVRVEELVAETVRAVRGLARARSVALTVDPGASPEEVRVPGPLGDVSRALRNLVENAIAHTPSSGEVSIQTSAREDAVTVRVVDPGPGVAPEDRENIFQPFYRGAEEQAGEFPGAGLGLAIAREIARTRGGDVRLQESTSGCCFELSLPRSRERSRESARDE